MKSDKTDGWIEWKGGACPVLSGTAIDVKYRDGYIAENIPAMSPPGVESGERCATYWGYTGLDSDIVAYRIRAQENGSSFPKQDRYKDCEGNDWIDECAASFTHEEFRGAMKFTVGKYNRRIGKKDDELAEVIKMEDYCHRWRLYLEQQRDSE